MSCSEAARNDFRDKHAVRWFYMRRYEARRTRAMYDQEMVEGGERIGITVIAGPRSTGGGLGQHPLLRTLRTSSTTTDDSTATHEATTTLTAAAAAAVTTAENKDARTADKHEISRYRVHTAVDFRVVYFSIPP